MYSPNSSTPSDQSGSRPAPPFFQGFLLVQNSNSTLSSAYPRRSKFWMALRDASRVSRTYRDRGMIMSYGVWWVVRPMGHALELSYLANTSVRAFTGTHTHSVLEAQDRSTPREPIRAIHTRAVSRIVHEDECTRHTRSRQRIILSHPHPPRPRSTLHMRPPQPWPVAQQQRRVCSGLFM